MQQLKRMMKEQHRDLENLASEVQRKEITPDRIIRLMKIVKRNVEIIERITAVLEEMGAPDLPESDLTRRLARTTHTLK
jgi:hypothetical protein